MTPQLIHFNSLLYIIYICSLWQIHNCFNGLYFCTVFSQIVITFSDSQRKDSRMADHLGGFVVVNVHYLMFGGLLAAVSIRECLAVIS